MIKMIATQFSIVVSLLVGGVVAGCGDEGSTYKKVEPATIEKIDGSKLMRITLTPEAVKRIDLKTVVVRETQVNAVGASTVVRKVVPYGSLIYDEYGKTWVYASTGERSFERKAVEVDYIDGDNAVLASGPPKQTHVATSGAAELYGVEGGIGVGKK